MYHFGTILKFDADNKYILIQIPQLFKENNVQTCPTIIKKISIDVEGFKKGK